MDINLECIYCTIKKADSSPYLNAQIIRLLNSKFNLGDIYYEIKKEYNNLLISMEEEILRYIYTSQDKLLTALKYAMFGNYIDFGAMDKVDIDKLKKLITSAKEQVIDVKEYKKFLQELKDAKQIAYIVDNAGEIVFDKIFIKVINEIYPNIIIYVIVRGKPALNDATIIDAEEVGLCEIVNVVENGTDIPGTQLDKINSKSKEIIDNADLIIAKGQGNFETLFGCGKNIYYIFLCKCDLFIRRFNIEKFKGIFVNERNEKDMIG